MACTLLVETRRQVTVTIRFFCSLRSFLSNRMPIHWIAPRSHLVPDTSCAVMRYLLLAGFFELFHGVVEEEIDQNSIDLSFRVALGDLPSDLLDTPYATA